MAAAAAFGTAVVRGRLRPSNALFLAPESVKHVRSERHKPIGRRKTQVAQAVITPRRDPEKILVAAERREVVVGSRRIYGTGFDPFCVEQHSANLPAAWIRERTGCGRRLKAEQSENWREAGIGDVRTGLFVAASA